MTFSGCGHSKPPKKLQRLKLPINFSNVQSVFQITQDGAGNEAKGIKLEILLPCWIVSKIHCTFIGLTPACHFRHLKKGNN
jgi:hypothetical protein